MEALPLAPADPDKIEISGLKADKDLHCHLLGYDAV
jgi:hypothetical protein